MFFGPWKVDDDTKNHPPIMGWIVGFLTWINDRKVFELCFVGLLGIEIISFKDSLLLLNLRFKSLSSNVIFIYVFLRVQECLKI